MLSYCSVYRHTHKNICKLHFQSEIVTENLSPKSRLSIQSKWITFPMKTVSHHPLVLIFYSKPKCLKLLIVTSAHIFQTRRTIQPCIILLWPCLLGHFLLMFAFWETNFIMKRKCSISAQLTLIFNESLCMHTMPYFKQTYMIWAATEVHLKITQILLIKFLISNWFQANDLQFTWIYSQTIFSEF